MILCAAKGQTAFEIAGRALVHEFGYLRRSHEGYGFDAGVVADRLDDLAVTVDDIEYTVRESGFFQEQGSFFAGLGQPVHLGSSVLAQVYGGQPIPITRILVFHIRESPGTFGTILSATLSPAINRYGYLKEISLSLHRNFTYRGQRRSYLSAACDAPAGFPGASFAFAHASMRFADGRTLSSTLTRSCKVRGA